MAMTPEVRAKVLAGWLPYSAPELRLKVVQENERAAGEGAEALRVALREQLGERLGRLLDEAVCSAAAVVRRVAGETLYTGECRHCGARHCYTPRAAQEPTHACALCGTSVSCTDECAGTAHELRQVCWRCLVVDRTAKADSAARGKDSEEDTGNKHGITASDWNSRHPVGAAVEVTVWRKPDGTPGATFRSRTRSQAWEGCHASVQVHGHAGSWGLDFVRALVGNEAELEDGHQGTPGDDLAFALDDDELGVSL